ncbi:MAG: thiamine phosphate synthase [Nannocystaceae bacterium]|nr:thiamine phosphate synthase [Nannocystaceae bacterium]
MIARLLAITPPVGPVPTTCVEVAADLGIPVSVLLRDPGTDLGEGLRPDARMGPLLRAARDAGVSVLASCAGADLERSAAIAQNAGLHGLQLRGDPSDAELLRARAAWPGAVLGASVHGAARPVAADYLLFAPVFAPRTTAAFTKSPAGLKPLAAWSALHPRVFALGGVTPQTAEACAKTGAYGLSGISTFFGSADTLADTLRALAAALTSAPDVSPRPRG